MARVRGWLVVVSALVALGCGGTGGDVGEAGAAAPAPGAAEAAGVAAPAPGAAGAATGEEGLGAPAADAPGADGLDALPWAERIPLERALAERDPAHAPRLEEGGAPALGRGPLTARLDASGAHVALGGHEVTLRAVAVGRGEARAPLAEAPQTLAGPEVRAERGAGVTEWWRSLPSGLEHGLTLATRPPGEGPLRVEVGLGGTLRATLRSDDAVELRDAGGALVATYAHLVALDAGGARVPSRLEAEGERLVLVTDDEDARYPLVLDPLLVGVEEATLSAADGATNDYLGYSVALSTDGSRALVGAVVDDTLGGSNAGSVRVFLLSGATWTEEATLTAADGAASDSLGISVALSADGSRALVGAPYDDTAGGANAGSARVFVRTGTTWTEEATLSAADGLASDLLGNSVALSADGSRALVGAPYDDTARGTDAGSARVFLRTGTTWTEEATLSAADGAANDNLGRSVALSADGSRALVGAPYDDTAGGTDAGSARVFLRTGTTWTAEATLSAADGATSDYLGFSVALSADGSRALVGAVVDDTPRGTDAGSARVFLRTGTTWTAEATLSAADGATDDNLGLSVAFSTDGSRALVGAHLDDTALGADAGSARVFLRTGTTWTEDATLTAADGAASDFLGQSVALSADGSRALVGAPYDDTAGGTNAGSARVFAVDPARADGAPCTRDAFCLSGFCTDGVCCTTRCGGGANDCQACSAALTGGADGTCAALSTTAAPTVTCRAAAGLCDTAEVCTPTSTACPADVLRPSTALCRSTAGECDRAEFCTGTSAACPSDTGSPAAAGSECRPAAGACDSPEVCDGMNGLCPPDLFAALGSVCRAAVGSCDVDETCSGTSAACPTDVLEARGTECRVAAVDSCDVTEVCDGRDGRCPADVFRPLDTPCRRARGRCDLDDVCTGSSPVCPDAAQPAGAVCRRSLGPCDADERCDGVAAECPSDVLLPAGAVCRAAGAGPCDADDLCTGASADCLPRYLSGVVCRTAAGACDIAEVCAGSSEACPPDGVLAAGVSCRPSTGDCDFPEACDETRAACPADRVFAAGVVCRPAAGSCDLAETCDGASGACPTERFLPEGSVCDARIADVCDTPDRCTGMGPSCPAQYLAGVECRGARGACDVPEFCTGGEVACPPDVVLSAGSVCRASTDTMCDPTEVCDGTASECPADETTCMPDAGPVDAGPVGPVDGGANDGGAGDVDGGASIDAGSALIPASGCGCRAGSGPGAWRSGLVALALALGLRRRR